MANIKQKERVFEDPKNRLIVTEPDHPAYQDALHVALFHAYKGEQQGDYYRARYRKNGWDIFYFGFNNEHLNSPSRVFKNGYAEIVVDGAHGNTRVLFNQSDTLKILNAVKRDGGKLSVLFKTNQRTDSLTHKEEQTHAPISCPF